MSRGLRDAPKQCRSLLDGVDFTKPIYQGYMYKQGHEHLAFNLRYFALYKTILVYYDKEEHFKRDAARGTLELIHCNDLKRCAREVYKASFERPRAAHRHKSIILEGLYLTKPEKKPKGAKYCFTLNAPNKKNDRHSFLLVTRTRDERKEWMDKLQEQNSSLLSVPGRRVSADTPQPPRRSSLAPSEGEAGQGRRGSCLDVNEMDIREGLSDVED